MFAVALIVSASLMGADPIAVELTVAADRATLVSEEENTEIRIHSSRGIGKATIRRTQGKWPKSLRLVIDLKGLEGLTLTCGDTRVKTALKSDSPEVYRQTKEGWMPAKPEASAVPTIKQSGGHILIDLPPDSLRQECEAILVEWIDFYRG
jgi:hypothetical protein